MPLQIFLVHFTNDHSRANNLGAMRGERVDCLLYQWIHKKYANNLITSKLNTLHGARQIFVLALFDEAQTGLLTATETGLVH